jgi:hypothetical protein
MTSRLANLLRGNPYVPLAEGRKPRKRTRKYTRKQVRKYSRKKVRKRA